MITPQDKELLRQKGISEEQIAEQLTCFEKGFPYLKLAAAASLEKGILAPAAEAVSSRIYSNFLGLIMMCPKLNAKKHSLSRLKSLLSIMT